MGGGPMKGSRAVAVASSGGYPSGGMRPAHLQQQQGGGEGGMRMRMAGGGMGMGMAGQKRELLLPNGMAAARQVVARGIDAGDAASARSALAGSGASMQGQPYAGAAGGRPLGARSAYMGTHVGDVAGLEQARAYAVQARGYTGAMRGGLGAGAGMGPSGRAYPAANPAGGAMGARPFKRMRADAVAAMGGEEGDEGGWQQEGGRWGEEGDGLDADAPPPVPSRSPGMARMRGLAGAVGLGASGLGLDEVTPQQFSAAMQVRASRQRPRRGAGRGDAARRQGLVHIACVRVGVCARGYRTKWIACGAQSHTPPGIHMEWI